MSASPLNKSLATKRLEERSSSLLLQEEILNNLTYFVVSNEANEVEYEEFKEIILKGLDMSEKHLEEFGERLDAEKAKKVVKPATRMIKTLAPSPKGVSPNLTPPTVESSNSQTDTTCEAGEADDNESISDGWQNIYDEQADGAMIDAMEAALAQPTLADWLRDDLDMMNQLLAGSEDECDDAGIPLLSCTQSYCAGLFDDDDDDDDDNDGGSPGGGDFSSTRDPDSDATLFDDYGFLVVEPDGEAATSPASDSSDDDEIDQLLSGFPRRSRRLAFSSPSSCDDAGGSRSSACDDDAEEEERGRGRARRARSPERGVAYSSSSSNSSSSGSSSSSSSSSSSRPPEPLGAWTIDARLLADGGPEWQRRAFRLFRTLQRAMGPVFAERAGYAVADRRKEANEGDEAGGEAR